MSSYTPKIAPGGTFASSLSYTLLDLARAVGEVNVANGWDTSRAMQAVEGTYASANPKWVVAHKIAELGLIGTEVAEAIEEVRHGRAMNDLYYLDSDGVALTGREVEIRREQGRPDKPQGVPSELADIVIRVLDIADAYGIDLGEAIVHKLNHNATRGLHHGGKAL